MTDTKGRSSDGPALRAAATAEADAWLQEQCGDLGAGAALGGVGALGRGELVPGSDLDLVFLHEPGRSDAPALAEKLWYSVWDSRWSLDHSVRTPAEALAISRTDLKAAAGLLDLRLVAGDAELAAATHTKLRAQWAAQAKSLLPQVLAAASDRAERFGELAFLLEPDLKEARGGLRDSLVPRQVAVAQVADRPGPELDAARVLLLDVRGALHARAVEAGRKPSDRLLLQEQDGVASLLGYADANALMAAVAAASRTVAYAVDVARRQVRAAFTPARTGIFRRGSGRVPVAPGVVSQGGEIVLAADADPAADGALVMRAARAAAETDLPLAAVTLQRLAAAPGPAAPWTDAERDAFVGLLGAGKAAVPVIETLDREGIWERWMPSWSRVRSRPQRNAFHRFTVDRHLLETAGEAAALTRNVSRPDLLLLAGLLHDLGKGWPGEDHTDAGIRELPPLAATMGLPAADADILVTLIRCHLILAELATTRDLSDPATAQQLADAVGSREALLLLRSLTEADSMATGPAMWSKWKAGLLDDLVRRASAVLAGADPVPPEALSPEVQELIAAGTLAVRREGDRFVVVVPDATGVLATVVGVLSLQRMEIRGLGASIHGPTALITATVAPRFGGDLPDPVQVRGEVASALAGDLDVAARLAERAAAYPVPARALLAPARVLWDDEPSGDRVVVEVRAPDAPGLLARIAGALSRCDVAVHAARCVTLGAEAVDAFYVTERDGSPVAGRERRNEVEDALLAVAAVNA